MQRQWYQLNAKVGSGAAAAFSPMVIFERCDPTPEGTQLSDLQLYAVWTPKTWTDATPVHLTSPEPTCNSITRSFGDRRNDVYVTKGCVSVKYVKAFGPSRRRDSAQLTFAFDLSAALALLMLCLATTPDSSTLVQDTIYSTAEM